ncbi:MAG: hypothetical protein JSU90_07310 [Nitrospiraceae bacterium]|nr:MAG: hypothetical protein JSU90_07310 [Nitrospiraceae bacterium]
MIKMCYGAVLCLVLFIASAFPALGEITGTAWEAADSGINEADMHHLIGTEQGHIMYASSRSSVYRKWGSGKQWMEILSLRSSGSRINAIAASPGDGSTVYAATDSGLFMSSDSGAAWTNIFSGIGEAERAVLSVAVPPDTPDCLVIGTGDGLFLTTSRGRTWGKSSSIPSGTSVLHLAVHPARPSLLYALTVRGVYKSTDRGSRWERVLPLEPGNEEQSSDNDADRPEENGLEDRLAEGFLAMDPHHPGAMYAGISGAGAVHVSRDSGSSWGLLSTVGLGRADIRHIVPDMTDPEILYAATARGVFHYSRTRGTWQEVYSGMGTSDVRSLTFVRRGEGSTPALWAATARGLYRMSAVPSLAGHPSGNEHPEALSPEEAFALFAHEPTIAEIREAAIEYAEVQPRKISAWRRAAARKALLPDLNRRYGKGEDWQSSTYFYSTKDEKFKDDDITRGDDEAWSVSLTWELGDLIWNDAQTSIDSRSRLMVQLRDDVLSEITRLYYERRRLQVDLLVNIPGETTERIEKNLRLMELTAKIDAMTGSYLSERLAQAGPAAGFHGTGNYETIPGQ